MEPFLGEIRMFTGNFAPRNWAYCQGQLMAIASNTALFSLLGTYYGGNGATTFALPNLQGRVPIMYGQGPGLSNYVQGEIAGVETVTLTVNQIPAHTHALGCVNAAGTRHDPSGRVPAIEGTQSTLPYQSGGATVTMAPALQPVGGSQPHSNMQPYLTMNYIIALYGIYPPRG